MRKREKICSKYHQMKQVLCYGIFNCCFSGVVFNLEYLPDRLHKDFSTFFLSFLTDCSSGGIANKKVKPQSSDLCVLR